MEYNLLQFIALGYFIYITVKLSIMRYDVDANRYLIQELILEDKK